MENKFLEAMLLFLPLSYGARHLSTENYTLQTQARNPAIYAQSARDSNKNCGTLQEIFDNSPEHYSKQMLAVTQYTSRTDENQKFVIEFYRNNASKPDLSQGIIGWIDKKDFYAFLIFEYGKPKQHPTASGYFRDQTMLVLYDIFTRKGKELLPTAPDGFVDGGFCYSLNGERISKLLAHAIETIVTERIKSTKNKQQTK